MIVVGILVSVGTLAGCLWLLNRYNRTGEIRWIVIGAAVFVFGLNVSAGFVPSGSGGSEKCWNYGGRSDDTYNC